MLRTTSAEWTFSASAWAQAASTAGRPSESTAVRILTNCRSPSSEPASLRRMPLAAPELTREDYLERIVGRIPQEAQEAPLSALQSEIADRARRAMEAGDESKINDLRKQCSTLIGFTEYRFPRYQPARHHRLIAEQLERVERREIDRLMLDRKSTRLNSSHVRISYA